MTENPIKVFVTKDGVEREIDTDVNNPEVQRRLMINLLGRYLCATRLGYEAAIVFYTSQENFGVPIQNEPDLPEMELLKRKGVYLTGSMAADYLCGIVDENVVYRFRHLEELHETMRRLDELGIPYPYKDKRILEVPFDAYRPFYDQAVEILRNFRFEGTQRTGREGLEDLADALLARLKR